MGWYPWGTKWSNQERSMPTFPPVQIHANFLSGQQIYKATMQENGALGSDFTPPDTRTIILAILPKEFR